MRVNLVVKASQGVRRGVTVKKSKGQAVLQNKMLLEKQIQKKEHIIRVALRDDLAFRKEPAIDRVILVLELAKNKELGQLMRKMNYFVFDWAIDHENLKLLDALIKTVAAEDHFLMLEHDDYLALRKFVKESITLTPEAYYKVASVKCEILMHLIKIEPHTVMQVVRSELERIKKSQHPIDPEVVSLFENDLENAARPVNDALVKENKLISRQRDLGGQDSSFDKTSVQHSVKKVAFLGV